MNEMHWTAISMSSPGSTPVGNVRRNSRSCSKNILHKLVKFCVIYQSRGWHYLHRPPREKQQPYGTTFSWYPWLSDQSVMLTYPTHRLCFVHNQVNARLLKPEFDCANLDATYDCGCGDAPVNAAARQRVDALDLEDDPTRDRDTGVGMIRGGRWAALMYSCIWYIFITDSEALGIFVTDSHGCRCPLLSGISERSDTTSTRPYTRKHWSYNSSVTSQTAVERQW